MLEFVSQFNLLKAEQLKICLYLIDKFMKLTFDCPPLASYKQHFQELICHAIHVAIHTRIVHVVCLLYRGVLWVIKYTDWKEYGLWTQTLVELLGLH